MSKLPGVKEILKKSISPDKLTNRSHDRSARLTQTINNFYNINVNYDVKMCECRPKKPDDKFSQTQPY